MLRSLTEILSSCGEEGMGVSDAQVWVRTLFAIAVVEFDLQCSFFALKSVTH